MAWRGEELSARSRPRRFQHAPARIMARRHDREHAQRQIVPSHVTRHDQPTTCCSLHNPKRAWPKRRRGIPEEGHAAGRGSPNNHLARRIGQRVMPRQIETTASKPYPSLDFSCRGHRRAAATRAQLAAMPASTSGARPRHPCAPRALRRLALRSAGRRFGIRRRPAKRERPARRHHAGSSPANRQCRQ